MENKTYYNIQNIVSISLRDLTKRYDLIKSKKTWFRKSIKYKEAYASVLQDWRTLDEIKESLDNDVVLINEAVYNKPRIFICLSDGRHITYHYETFDKAKVEFDRIISFVKEHNIELLII